MAHRGGLLTANGKKYLKFGIFLAFAGAVVWVLLFTPTGRHLLSPEGRKEAVAWIDRIVREAGPLGPPLFVLLYALGVLALPATLFNAVGGILFGKYLGSAYNILGATLGASAAFLLGRYLLRDLAGDLLTGKLGELDRKAEKHGFPVVFSLRILWFPFLVLNYGAAATRIRFPDFFWATLLGTTPSIVIITLFFGGLKEILASYRGPSDLLAFDILFPAALLGLSFLLPGVVRRIRGDREPEGAASE